LARLLAIFALLLAAPAAADTLDQVRAAGKLVWGADQEGGGPYVYPRDDDPNQVTGFEVELAKLLADYLKVKPEFYQGNWDKLPDLLRADKFDIVLNGYEWTPERADAMDASIPYYVYGLQLLVAKDDASLNTWDDLVKPRPDGSKRRIGVLTGSASDIYMSKFCAGEKCEVERYDGSTDTMRETETGKLDGTLQDTPIASFYRPRFAKLRPLGPPVAPGYYVIYVRKGERALVEAINEAIILMVRNGSLQRIYEKYGMWDDNQKQLQQIAETGRFYGYMKAVRVALEPDAKTPAAGALAGATGAMPTQDKVELSVRKSGWDVVRSYGTVLVESAGMTVVLALLSFPLAILAGLLIAVGRLYGPVWVRAPLTAYVEFLRGTPLMLQLYFIVFFLPELGVNIPAFTTAILGLAVNYSAYESEIYRAGLQAIPFGQMEAALSLGMSRGMAIRRIIVPQAVRIVIPPVVNDFIALFKDTSVCSVVTIIELTKRFSVLSMSTQATIELMGMTALLYLAMSYPMSLAARRIELRLGTGGPR
jgi:polar amino acid transport system substrate-binding protein